MRLRRGFIKEAEEYALEFRQEMALEKTDPLCPHKLAAHLEIPVHRISTFSGIPDETKLYFMTKGKDEFSAAVIPIPGEGNHIIFNDYTHLNRQNSSLMHEISHILLGHEFIAPLTGDGERKFSKIDEHEANQLGFTLLVPKHAARAAIEQFSSVDEAAFFYGVSNSLMTFRIRKTDASRWAYNRANKRRFG
ncbi:MAG: ImmA/IrrE family metallo-endopeptidase [Pseudomonadota bacterium]